MKKFLLSFIFLISISFAQAAVCVDLPKDLGKGSENAQVLLLQNFLAERGYLKVKPNGYFGPSTVAAVKAYQKAVKYKESGAVLPMLRAKIKKDTCTATSTAPTSAKLDVQPVKVADKAKATTTPAFIATAPRPQITLVEKATIFLNGSSTWTIAVTGKNFSTSTPNKVTFFSQQKNKRYTIGSFTSSDGKSITLPTSIGLKEYACEPFCKAPEKLTAGDYYVFVATTGGGESAESVTGIASVRDLNVVGASVTSSKAIPFAATSTRLGTFTFNAKVPVSISSVKFNVQQTTNSSTSLKNFIFKDEVTGATIGSVVAMNLYEGEFKNIGVYGDVLSERGGAYTATFTVDVTDIAGKKATTFVTKPFSLVVDNEPSFVTDARNYVGPPTLDGAEPVTILAGASTTWGALINGSNFSTSSNKVYFKQKFGNRKYYIGDFKAPNKYNFELPNSLGARLFECGSGCLEKLAPGDYDMTVVTKGGESVPKNFSIKTFSYSISTATQNVGIPRTSPKSLFGTLTYSSGVLLKVNSVALTFTLDKNTTSIGGPTLVDELTKKTVGTDFQIQPNETKIVGVYGSVSTTAATTGQGYFTLTLFDYVGNKGKQISTIRTPAFLTTFSF